MKKLVLGAILVLLIAIGGGVYFLLSNLDELVKNAIQTYGSEAAQTSVAVDRVKIGLQDGSGTISGLSVGNPPGFSSPRIFSLGEIATRIDLKSISKELVTIDEVRIVAPEVFFEINQAGGTNLDRLKQNLSGGGSGSAAKSAPSSGGGSQGPNILIRRLLFADGQIHARVAPLGKNYELKLPRIELTNLGGKNGSPAKQVAEQLLTLLSDAALKEIKKQGLDQYKKELEAEVNQRLDAEKQKLKDKVNEKVGEEVGTEVEQVLKGLLKKK